MKKFIRVLVFVATLLGASLSSEPLKADMSNSGQEYLSLTTYNCYLGYCCWGLYLKIDCTDCGFKYMWFPELSGRCDPEQPE